MSCWVEYWNKDRCLITVVTSYIPKKDDWVKIKTSRMKASRLHKVVNVVHELDTDDPIKEKFKVSVW